MALRKRGKKWQIDLPVPTGKKDEAGKEIKTRYRKAFDLKKDAEAEHDKMKTLVRENRFLDVKKEYKTIFKALVEKYEENFSHQRSFDSWKSLCLKNFKAAFGENTLLANIKYVDLETYRNALRSKLTYKGTLRTTAAINREMSCLHHLFQKGVEWEMLDKSPFERGGSLLQKENNERKRYLTEDELTRLLDACPLHLRWIVTVAVNTGMRRGELLSLKWDQVRNGFIYLSKTKTDESRQIPINDTVAELFKTIRKAQRTGTENVFTFSQKFKRKETRSVKVVNPVKGDPIDGIKTSFTSACKRAGIEDFRFHDLRHTFASQLIMRGAGLKDVQELLGHKTLAMTMRYAHLSQDHKKKAVNLLNGLTAKKPPCHKMSQNAVFDPSRTIPENRQVVDFKMVGARGFEPPTL